MFNTLNSRISKHAEESINNVSSTLSYVLPEPKIALGLIADNIQDMIIRGEDFDAVKAYMRECSSDEFKEKIQSYTFYSIYGYFDIFDDFYNGIDWIPVDNYDATERPWYIAAIEAGGEIAMTSVYMDIPTNTPVIGYARCLYDKEGKLLGVVSMDVPLDIIAKLVHSDISENSYGCIADNNQIVIVHPDERAIGKSLSIFSPELAPLVDSGLREVAQFKFTNHYNENSLLYAQVVYNDWYVCFIIPEAEYYADLYIMILLVSVLGIIMATILSLVLLSIDEMRQKSELHSKQKSSFLANMSHEIRTPMNSIIGFSELAKDDDVPPKTYEYLVNIHESALFLLEIINDILDISKIESGKIELEKIPFDLPDVFSYCQSIIAPKAEEKKISLYCYAEPSFGKKLLGDPIKLRQIIINLLSNAIKFTNVGTVKLLAAVKSSTMNSTTIGFEIKDSGIGMTQEQISRIFEPFMQADNSVTRRFGGTGLGLAIANNNIELMGGKLIVESVPGIGSKFSFDITFDFIEDFSNVTSKKIIFNGIEKPKFTGEALICEDNGLNQQVICDHLARVGIQTIVTYNGKEGVEVVADRVEKGEKPFDLIFMDIHMPVMDGLEASTQIRQTGVETPIIAFTANIMSNDLELYKNSGMDECLGKPFSSQELWTCLSKFLSVDYSSPDDNQNHANEEDNLQKKLRYYFIKDNRGTYKLFTNALEEGDFKTAHRIVHTVKSNAGHIDEEHLQKAAADIEKSLKDEENPPSEEQLKTFETELNKVLNKLMPVLNEENSKKITITDDKEKIQEIISRLEPLLTAKNPACEDMLDEVRSIEGCEELVTLIENFNFKQACNELSEIKAKWI